MDFNGYMTSRQAYDYLRERGMCCSYGWFRKQVQFNKGPRCVHISERRDLFKEADLIAWQESWIKNHSTP